MQSENKGLRVWNRNSLIPTILLSLTDRPYESGIPKIAEHSSKKAMMCNHWAVTSPSLNSNSVSPLPKGNYLRKCVKPP